ncbi:MAG TPA: hypothetical protein EYQ08_03115 [Planctomycetes bacterium]|nr:hypothetical protein [Planctomycetota bacterium]HIK81304.1 hypothetical protein [Planctomycetota bacterium]
MDLQFGTYPADLDHLIEELQEMAIWTTDEKIITTRKIQRSHWSVGEQLDHLLTAALLNLKAIRILVLGRGQTPSEGLTAGGKACLDVGMIPLGSAVAPEYVQPTAGRGVAELESLRLKVLQMCGDLVGDASRLDDRGQVLTHFAVGEMGARQWLRFALVHSRHHVAIVKRILEPTGERSP